MLIRNSLLLLIGAASWGVFIALPAPAQLTEAPARGSAEAQMENSACDLEELEQKTDAFRQTVLRQLNALRQKGCTCGEEAMVGVQKLTWDTTLAKAARKHAAYLEQVEEVQHEGRNGSSPEDRIQEAGYNMASGGFGENAGHGYSVSRIEGMLALFKQSPPHCKNMMSCRYTEVGVGCCEHYWVMNFGVPRDHGSPSRPAFQRRATRWINKVRHSEELCGRVSPTPSGRLQWSDALYQGTRQSLQEDDFIASESKYNELLRGSGLECTMVKNEGHNNGTAFRHFRHYLLGEGQHLLSWEQTDGPSLGCRYIKDPAATHFAMAVGKDGRWHLVVARLEPRE